VRAASGLNLEISQVGSAAGYRNSGFLWVSQSLQQMPEQYLSQFNPS
jgi:hypothetical protein